ncbi:MAG: hypothetical protein E6G10_28365 [Actinobacteria bacterium]|nr:MAG: hypothetical protein E6G10_28365 [Actinomycetota bacterium]
MKKILMLAAIAALAVPATASAAPETNFRAEAPLFDAVTPSNTPAQVGNVRYREESLTADAISKQEIRVSGQNLQTLDANGNPTLIANGTGMGSDVWTFDPVAGFVSLGDVSDVNGSPIVTPSNGASYKLDARFESTLAPGKDNTIADIDATQCSLVIVSDDAGNVTAVSDVLGDAAACQPAP